MLDKQEQSLWGTRSALLKGFGHYSMFIIIEYTLLLAYHELKHFYSTSDYGTWSSVVCISKGVEDLTEVNVTLVIDKSIIFTTKKFSYRENPNVTDVKPNCSFNR